MSDRIYGSHNAPAPLTLLGKTSEYPNHPDNAKLECFPLDPPCPIITFHTKEFTSLCARTKQPDYGEITITYQPGVKALESKSLKLFLGSYRNVPMFYEFITKDILERLVQGVDPVWMEITCEMNPRGGIALISTLRFPYEDANAEDE